MDRFILRFRGQGPLPADTVREVQALPDTRILEQTPRMLLVEGPEDALRRLLATKQDWILARERSYARPDPRPTVKRKE